MSRSPVRSSTRPLTRPVALLASVLVVGVAVTGSAAAAGGPQPFRTVDLAQNNAYGEPSLALSNTGNIAVSTPGGPGVNYWFSQDDGHTFRTTTTSSTNGGGDSELDYLPNGDLISADLEVTDSNVKITHDDGRTFTPVAGNQANPGAVGAEQDRQWFAHSPDGTQAYLVYHDFAAEGEFFARSTDGGRTWNPDDGQNPVLDPKQVDAAPGVAGTPAKGRPPSLVDQGGNTFSGPILVDPKTGELYVVYSISDAVSNTTGAKTPPFGPTRQIVVEHSADDGATWNATLAVSDVPNVGDPTGANTPSNGAIFPWGTVDAAGNVYVLYNSDKGSLGHYHAYYTYSTDHGLNWSDPVAVDAPQGASGEAIYSTGQALADGSLDMAWYESDNATSTDDNNATWQVQFATIRAANTASPVIARQQVSPGNNHEGSICLQGLLCVEGGDRSLLDFFELAIDPVDGMAEIAYADNHAGTNGTGVDQVVWAKQQSGASALPQPGANAPEVPYAALLVLAGGGALGASVIRARRRRA